MHSQEEAPVATETSFIEINRQVIAEFRANNGKVGGMFANAPLVLITAKGAKSGQPRITPLAYTRDGDRLVVIASKGGAPSHPEWYYNFVANPDVTIELPGETYPARAREVTGEERARLFNQMAAQMPNFAEYQRQTSRTIPVFVVERTA
jgi:deazaflavin-dependent oxidoreductase (nitroreductase family)